jgi:hypothetical protein
MPAGGRHELHNSEMGKQRAMRLLMFSRLRFWLARARGCASLRALKKEEQDEVTLLCQFPFFGSCFFELKLGVGRIGRLKECRGPPCSTRMGSDPTKGLSD